MHTFSPAKMWIAGLEALSRNGFSQVNAIFTDSTDLYFARQQVSERLAQARDTLPEGVQPQIEKWLAEQEVDLAVTVLDGILPEASLVFQNLLQEVPILTCATISNSETHKSAL